MNISKYQLKRIADLMFGKEKPGIDSLIRITVKGGMATFAMNKGLFRCRIQTKTETGTERFAASISSRSFVQFVNNAKDEFVRIVKTDDGIQMRNGSASVLFVECKDVHAVWPYVKVDSHIGSVISFELVKALKVVMSCVATEADKFVLEHVCLDATDGENICFVGCDGRRLGFSSKLFAEKRENSEAFPIKRVAAECVCAVAELCCGDMVSISKVIDKADWHWLSFVASSNGDTIEIRVPVETRLTYPKYRPVIPTASIFNVVIDADEFITGLNLIASPTFHKSQQDEHGVMIEFSGGNMRVELARYDDGKETNQVASFSLPAEIAGDSEAANTFQICVKYKYLVEAAAFWVHNPVRLSFSGSHSPVVFDGEALNLFVIMPKAAKA